MSTHYCARCLSTFTDDPPRCGNLSCGSARPPAGWGEVLGDGDLLDRRYRITRALAVGGAGLCYLAREVDDDGAPTGPDLAIKVLYDQRASGPFLRRLSNEAQILQDLAHPHIVQCRGFVQRTGQPPYLVTLFESGGSLADHVERHGSLPPRVAAAVLRQILQALDVAHQRGVVHRDLKPENVLLREPVGRDDVPHVRVADFGIAKVQGGVGERLTRVGAFIGTPEFAAPEQFEGRAPTPATDVFAAGALLFHLLTGRPPVRFTHRADIAQSYEELLARIPPRLPSEIDPEALSIPLLQEVIDHTMSPSPDDRWTLSQVLSRLGALLDGARGGPRHTVDLTDQGAPPRDRAAPEIPPGSADAPPADAPPPMDPPAAELLDAEPPPTRGRMVLGLAGAFAAMLGVGLVVLVVGGVGLGALGSLSGGGEPAQHADPPVALLDATTSDPALVAERDALEAHLGRVATDLGTVCKADGTARVELRVAADGAVESARIDPATLSDAEVRGCVERALGRSRLPRRVARPARLRSVLAFD